MWLRDFLPTIFPNCRIMTYGYNANVVFGSMGTIRTHAKYFLENIGLERGKKDVSIDTLILSGFPGLIVWLPL